MTPEALLTAATTLVNTDPEGVGLLDLCNVIRITSTVDDYGGVTTSETTLASNVACLYEERTFAGAPIAGMSENYATHDLFLLANAVTRLIQPHYKIVVLARGDTPQLTFEDPVRLDESLSPLIHLGATIKA